MVQKTSEKIGITLVGGPTVIIEIGGVRFLTDPTFDDGGAEYPSGPVTLTKLDGPAIPVHVLPRIDAVLLSHDQHPDNLDVKGKQLLGASALTLTTPASAERLGGTARGLNTWEVCDLPAPTGEKVRVTATPARHGPSGIEAIAGPVTGFYIEDGAGGRSVYVTGDTVFFEGVAEVARRFHPNVVLAFAGAARPVGVIDLTMTANDVVDTAHAFPDAIIVPVHTEGWAHLNQKTDALVRSFRVLGMSERLAVVSAGGSLVV